MIAALDKFVESQTQTAISFKTRAGTVWQGLFADISYGFPDPDSKLTAAEDREYLPLVEVWEKWWRERGPELRDTDGMEIPRALAWLQFFNNQGSIARDTRKIFPAASGKIFGQTDCSEKLKNWHVYRILSWLVRLDPPAGVVDFVLGAAESSLALVPRESLLLKSEDAARLEQSETERVKAGNEFWKIQAAQQEFLSRILLWRSDKSPYMAWLEVLKWFNNLPQAWKPEDRVRHWKMWRWLDEPVRPQETGGDSGVPKRLCLPRTRSNMAALARAHAAGGATDADVLEQLLGVRDGGNHYWSKNFQDLDQLSSRKPRTEYAQFKKLIPLVDHCRKRILELELSRGDNPTAASTPALSLSSIEGVGSLVAILRALGKRNFVRGWSRDNQSMETVFSHLVRCCFPLPDETAEDFASQVKAAGIKQERLIELALYAPQWARFVEHALGWEMLTEAVWWIHAHTKGNDWSVDREIRKIWEADMNSYTSLSPADLLEGGVDVAWFHRIFKALGAKKWAAID
ncbi:MAG TPA: DUF5724 domain-containing protein, partial [Verrucomicrobiae bacterium]|nr:DUF5724 domain-containing protein [Verrucomicrobiae bacterium]